jgi:hypothetical protein
MIEASDSIDLLDLASASRAIRAVSALGKGLVEMDTGVESVEGMVRGSSTSQPEGRAELDMTGEESWRRVVRRSAMATRGPKRRAMRAPSSRSSR